MKLFDHGMSECRNAVFPTSISLVGHCGYRVDSNRTSAVYQRDIGVITVCTICFLTALVPILFLCPWSLALLTATFHIAVFHGVPSFLAICAYRHKLLPIVC